jgi:hypothetical protein
LKTKAERAPVAQATGAGMRTAKKSPEGQRVLAEMKELARENHCLRVENAKSRIDYKRALMTVDAVNRWMATILDGMPSREGLDRELKAAKRRVMKSK